MGPNAVVVAAALALATSAAAAAGELLPAEAAANLVVVLPAPGTAVTTTEPDLDLPPMPLGSGRASRFEWPTGSPGNVLRHFSEPSQRWSPGHRGVDLAAEPGAEVIAPAAGRVAFAGVVAGRPVLSVLHGAGVRTTYEPVDSHVAAGQWVNRGDLLGRIATEPTHCSSPCLHWGVREGRYRYLDPLALLAREPLIRLFVDVPGQALG